MNNFFWILIGFAICLFAAPEINAYMRGLGMKRWGTFLDKYVRLRTFYNKKPTIVEKIWLLSIIVVKVSIGLGLIIFGIYM